MDYYPHLTTKETKIQREKVDSNVLAFRRLSKMFVKPMV